MDQLLQDLKQSFRVLWKNPAFAAAAIAALTLGIGANTAIFTVVNAVLLRPIGLPDPDRLVYFMNVAPGGSGPASSPAKFLHYRAQTDVVSDVSAFTVGTVNYTGGTFPEQLQAGRVSANFFKLVGARFEKGRAFSPEEDLPNGEKTVVLSSAAWKTRFNSDPDIVGKSVSLDGAPYVVIGVLAPNAAFRELGGADPRRVDGVSVSDRTPTDQGHYFRLPGQTQPWRDARAGSGRASESTARVSRAFPNAVPAQNSFGVMPVRELLVRNVRQSLLVLAGAVALVLLIACANVANLLLARASGRTREVAVRAAIGGSRGRIVRQLLTESLVMSAIGGVLGLALGMAGIRALLSVNTAGLPRVGDARRLCRSRLARRALRGRHLGSHRRGLRIDAGAADIARRSDDVTQGEQRKIRHRRPSGLDALDARRHRSRAGHDPAHWVRAAHQERRRTVVGRSRLRCDQCADDEDGVDGRVVPVGRTASSRWCRTASSGSGRSRASKS